LDATLPLDAKEGEVTVLDKPAFAYKRVWCTSIPSFFAPIQNWINDTKESVKGTITSSNEPILFSSGDRCIAKLLLPVGTTVVAPKRSSDSKDPNKLRADQVVPIDVSPTMRNW